MKITGEIANVVNIVRKNDPQQRNAENTTEASSKAYDSVTVENKQASGVTIENLDEVRDLVQNVTSGLTQNPSRLHNLNAERLANLIN